MILMILKILKNTQEVGKFSQLSVIRMAAINAHHKLQDISALH